MTECEQKAPVPGLWRGAGVWYLAFCLASLAIGLWPEAVLPAKAGSRPLPLPTLQTLAAGQAMFFLLVYPLILFRRHQKQIGTDPVYLAAGEVVVLLVVSTPFYYVAAHMADAVWMDVAREIVCVLCVAAVGAAGAAWMCRGGAWRACGAMLLLVLGLMMPAMTFATAEAISEVAADSLWLVSPTTYMWQNSQERLGTLLPRPLWPAVAYLLLAAAMVVTVTAFRSSNRCETPASQT